MCKILLQTGSRLLKQDGFFLLLYDCVEVGVVLDYMIPLYFRRKERR